MCYSAQVMQDYKQYLRRHPSAKVDFPEFLGLFTRRSQGEPLILPKGMTDAFRFGTPASDIEAQCQELVTAWDANQVAKLHEQLNAQQLRLDGALAKLASKPTKKAEEDKRIATNKIADLSSKITDLDRSEPRARDTRIFPNAYAPVLTMDDVGQLVVRPQRYLCRQPGMPASIDQELSANYNARRDNLGKFWRRLFLETRGVVYIFAFFEHVSLHDAQQRPLDPGEKREGAIIRFKPAGGGWLPMACLWSHWRAQGAKDLLSFAIITDEPNPEVRAYGHDRTPVSLDEENIMAWLTNVEGATAATYDHYLDIKKRPFYEHELVR